VLLLAGTVAVSVTLHDRERVGVTVDGRASAERALSAGDSALRAAVRAASAAAARDPVTAPADTPAGRALNDSALFRDALRLRIYLAASERFDATDQRVGDTRSRLWLPPTSDRTESLRAAKRRVRIERVEGGLRATLRGIRVRTYRDGRRVADRERSLSVTVETPALALHDRVETFERRLDRSPDAGRGLGRRLTGWLYALAWGRGYAQYGGAPITNVLGTRHLALGTNAAALAIQRSVFGAADADGLAAQQRARLRVGVSDLAAAVDGPTGWTDRIFRDDGGDADPSLDTPQTPGPGPDDRMTVRVGSSADVAFRAFRDDIRTVAERGYEARVRRSTAVALLDTERTVVARPPGGGWERVAVDRSTTTTVSDGDGDGTAASIPDDHERYAGYVRRVRTTTTLRTTWRRGNETRTTAAESTTVRRVAVAVSGRPAGLASVPSAPVAPLYERGGALDGPNFRAVPDRAVERLIDDRGGVDEIARRAVTEGPEPLVLVVSGDRPADLEDWLYADLVDLRESVRGVSAEVRRGTVGTGANTPEQLAAALRERRVELLRPPSTYRGVANRTRLAVRAAYLDAVLDRLDREAETAATTRSRLLDLLADRGALPEGGIEGLLERRGGPDPDPRPVLTTMGGDDVSLTVDGEPPYLTAVAVDGRRAPGVAGDYYGLVTRNENLFAHPYGDAADEVVSAFVDEVDRVSLSSAARTLRAANQSSDDVADADLRQRRGELTDAIGTAMETVVHRTAARLRARSDINRTVARDAVRAGLATYPTVDARAAAVANGSAADPIAAALTDRLGAEGLRERDRLRLWTRRALRRAVDVAEARPKQSPVERTGEAARRVARSRVEDAVANGLRNVSERYRERLYGEGPGAVPSGLPVTPVPGMWYGTVNVWTVEARGEYARFAVSAPVGGPAEPGARIDYVRDGSTVLLDVDGDVERERLGRSERVGFDVETVVAVAVPPGGSGVGDANARDERSAGWPCPGAATAECDRANSTSLPGGDMIHEQRRDVDGMTPADLRAEYDADLTAAVETAGVDAAVEAAGVDRASVEALLAGERPDLSLPEAAALQALSEDAPGAETTVEIACEHLLLGMSTGVMDVDSLAAALEIDLGPKAVQQKLERRAPMTFDEFVHLQHAIADRQP
jgi:hypothetical protein